MKDKETCSICGKYLQGIPDSCNAAPVNDGICCQDCDMKIVTPRRLRDKGFEVDDGFVTKLNKEFKYVNTH